MAMNNGTSNLVEFRLVEQKTWQYQEAKLSMADFLSWSFGPHMLKTLVSPDLHVRTSEEVKPGYIKHFIEAIREQEEFIPEGRYLVGSRTGKEIDAKSVKGTIKLESAFDVTEAWESLMAIPADKTDNNILVWQNAWRIAYSLAVKLFSKERGDKMAKLYGVSPAVLAHAVKNWQSQSPAMLNKSYQNGKPVAKPVAKPVESVNGKEKATA